MEQQVPQSGQYHHYLPRFVARRWLQEVKTVTKPGRKSKGRRNKGRQRTREYKQELINTYDIQSSTLHMGTTDLGKTFGIVDMYKDDADLTDVYRVEKAFSKLESDAARVFQVLEDAEKRGRSSVELVRSQLNTLRKFLFLMHYRNGTHARQFIEGHFDPASARMVEQYRVKHGLADARAVWLRNLTLLLEDEHWEVATDERLLFTARMDYKMEALDMQLGLYRAPSGTEFVLTENGLGLAEGAQTRMHINMMSLGAQGLSFFPLTQSFPITPKLVIILRSRLLIEEAAFVQGGMPAEEARRLVYDGFSNVSYFDNIPRTPPKITHYPRLPPDSVDWARRPPENWTAEDIQKSEDYCMRGLLNGVPLGSRLRDKFVFAIDNLTKGQAQRVNTLLLTHCRETISFCAPTCLLRAIGAFEKDMELTIFGKRRYASLKVKLLAAKETHLSSKPKPTSPSASVSPEEEHLPPAPAPPEEECLSPVPAVIPTSLEEERLPPAPASPGPSGSVQTTQAVPMGTSLPVLRGAFKRKEYSVPTPNIPDISLSEPVSLSTVGSPEPEHLDDSNAEVLRTPTLAGVVTPVDVAPPANELLLPPVIHDCAPNNQLPPGAANLNTSEVAQDGVPPPVTKAATPHPVAAGQPVKLDAALPGLRGAFRRKPNVIAKGTPGSIGTQKLLASPARPPEPPVSESPDWEAGSKAQADIDTASAIDGVVTAVDDSLPVSESSFETSAETQGGSEPDTTKLWGGLSAEEDIGDETRANADGSRHHRYGDEQWASPSEGLFSIIATALAAKAVDWFFGGL
ncbi:uncharacterized protein B0H18DRAFT_143411 [Fomitopsis serialis]|uniref:uncharacterized protein n=1 Tax=Fomitopsis serialis TaxID=139415 RepID=UPI00200873F6|nr:uncharacterized protein B0H18DRAFT_143411 [Neoantrodia serialis]KAH9930221.1 hypothetical protein B0H18DRAFT_143411 [Neoantrodia serialis]